MSEANSHDPIVSVDNVTKQYRRDQNVLNVLSGLSLQLYPGDYVALMGPSGSGKSTLLNLIAGLDKPTSGRVTVCGQDLGSTSQSALAKWRSRHVGFIFQMYNLIPVLTAYENVELPLNAYVPSVVKPAKLSRFENCLGSRRFGQIGWTTIPRQLSGGQEQRVSIARAIATDPTLIVADEPTGDLRC